MRAMQERYRLRHPSLQGTLGPYTIEELHKAVEANSFPVDSRVLPVDATDEAANWRALHDLLGLPAPPAAAPPATPVTPATTTVSDRRRALRANSAYGRLRILIVVVASILVAINLLLMFEASSAIPLRGSWRSLPFALLVSAVIVIGAGMLLAVLDLADGSLQRNTHSDD